MATNRLKRSLRATLLGMVVNTFLAAGKLAAGVLGHSQALLADAVESLADVFSSIVVWRAMVVAEEPADKEHPYGHGKAEPLASAIVSTMLLLAAVGIVVFSVGRMLSHEPHEGPRAFTLIVLVAVVVIKELLFRFVVKEADSVDSSAVHADAWHHRSDAITSLAAAIGITISLIGGENYRAADDVAAIVAAGIIAFNGWRLLRPSMNELMDAAPNQQIIDRIKKIAATVEGVERVEKCMVREVGHLYFVDMHVEVDPQMTVSRGHEIAHDVKDKVRENVPAVRDVLVHVEPSDNSSKKIKAGR
jgi:cation diffusion facilitator family transporter